MTGATRHLRRPILLIPLLPKMRPYLNSFTAEVRHEAVKEVVAGLGTFFHGREVVTQAPLVIATAANKKRA